MAARVGEPVGVPGLAARVGVPTVGLPVLGVLTTGLAARVAPGELAAEVAAALGAAEPAAEGAALEAGARVAVGEAPQAANRPIASISMPIERDIRLRTIVPSTPSHYGIDALTSATTSPAILRPYQRNPPTSDRTAG